MPTDSSDWDQFVQQIQAMNLISIDHEGVSNTIIADDFFDNSVNRTVFWDDVSGSWQIEGGSFRQTSTDDNENITYYGGGEVDAADMYFIEQGAIAFELADLDGNGVIDADDKLALEASIEFMETGTFTYNGGVTNLELLEIIKTADINQDGNIDANDKFFFDYLTDGHFDFSGEGGWDDADINIMEDIVAFFALEIDARIMRFANVDGSADKKITENDIEQLKTIIENIAKGDMLGNGDIQRITVKSLSGEDIIVEIDPLTTPFVSDISVTIDEQTFDAIIYSIDNEFIKIDIAVADNDMKQILYIDVYEPLMNVSLSDAVNTTGSWAITGIEGDYVVDFDGTGVTAVSYTDK